MPSSGDAADDPAVWVHPSDSSQSLLIGNDKLGGLQVYGLDGVRRQRLTTATSFWGNVDVRQGVTVAGTVHDVVAAYNGGVRLFDVDANTRELLPLTEAGAPIATGSGEGLCLFRSTTSTLYLFVVTVQGRVRQYEITDEDADGLLSGALRREFLVGSEAEGCVADDETGALYVSQEDVGLWRYDAQPYAGTDRTLVDAVVPAGRIAADAEGVALLRQADGQGFVIVSAQNVADPGNSYFVAYARATGEYVGAFRVVDGDLTDGCSRTDGIEIAAHGLGPDFPRGVFVCQDDNNTAPGVVGNQNFKLVPLERVLGVLTDPEPPPTVGGAFVAAASTNANRTVHTVAVPASVQAGDILVAYLAWNTSATVTTPPRGWTQAASVGDSGMSARAWSRVATFTDAGHQLSITLSAISKADLSVAAYRHIDLGATLARLSGSGTTATTPTVATTEPAWVVSYWADKSASNTGLSVPGDQEARTSSTGTGSGRITAALADTDGPRPPGTVGGLSVVGTSSHNRAVAFTTTLTVR